MRQTGFTLAEVLIALALLGIVAAFTIPKILQASSTQSVDAKIKETVAILEEAWYGIKAQPQSRTWSPNVNFPGATLYQILVPSLNIVNGSRTVGLAAGVPDNMPVTHPCITLGRQQGWIQLHNGVLVTGLDNNVNINHYLVDPSTIQVGVTTSFLSTNYLLCIDADGPAGANTLGVDVFLGNFNMYGVFDNTIIGSRAKNFFWGDANGVRNLFGNNVGPPNAAVVTSLNR